MGKFILAIAIFIVAFALGCAVGKRWSALEEVRKMDDLIKRQDALKLIEMILPV